MERIMMFSIVSVLAILGLIGVFSQAQAYEPGYSQPHYSTLDQMGAMKSGAKIAQYCETHTYDRVCETILAKIAAEEGSHSAQRRLGTGPYYN